MTNNLNLHFPLTIWPPSLCQVLGNRKSRALCFNKLSGNTRILHHNSDLEFNYFVNTYLFSCSLSLIRMEIILRFACLFILSKNAPLNHRNMECKDVLQCFSNLWKLSHKYCKQTQILACDDPPELSGTSFLSTSSRKQHAAYDGAPLYQASVSVWAELCTLFQFKQL